MKGFEALVEERIQCAIARGELAGLRALVACEAGAARVAALERIDLLRARLDAAGSVHLEVSDGAYRAAVASKLGR